MRFRPRSIFALVMLISVILDERSARTQAEPNHPPRGLVRSLVSTGYRHPAAIQYACLDPSERTLFTLSEKGVYSWDLQTGEAHFLFNAERVRNALSISPDGRRLASIAGDAVALWDAKTGDLVKEFDESESGGIVSFQPDGKGVIIFRRETMERRSLEGGAPRIIGETAPFCRPVFAPNGKWFAASVPNESAGEIIVYDAQSLRKTATLSVGASVIGEAPNGLRMLSAGFSIDGTRLAVPAADGSIAIWDVNARKVVQSLKSAAEKRRPEEADCRYLLFSHDGRQLFAGTAAGTIRRWHIVASKELAPLRSHRVAVRSLHLIRGDTQLVSTDADGMIRRWDVAAGREIEPPDSYSGALHAQLSPRGDSALLLDSAGRMDIWDLSKGRLRTPIRAPGDLAMDTPWVEPHFGFTPDGKRVFLAEKNGKISIYDAGNGQPAGSLALPGYINRPTVDLRFCISSPDGQAFVVNRGPRRLRLIRASDGNVIWETPDVSPRGLCFTPVIAADGKGILLGVTTLEDKPYTELRGKLELVRLDPATGKVVSRTELKSDSRGDLAFFDQPHLSRDGRVLLIKYAVNELYLVDTVANKALHHHIVFLDNPALSADGKRMIGVSFQDIAVFEAATGKPLSHLPIGQQNVQSLHLLPDGRHALTAGGGGHACLWDLEAALPGAGGTE
jgi:WD40 repeat protein